MIPEASQVVAKAFPAQAAIINTIETYEKGSSDSGKFQNPAAFSYDIRREKIYKKLCDTQTVNLH